MNSIAEIIVALDRNIEQLKHAVLLLKSDGEAPTSPRRPRPAPRKAVRKKKTARPRRG